MSGIIAKREMWGSKADGGVFDKARSVLRCCLLGVTDSHVSLSSGTVRRDDALSASGAVPVRTRHYPALDSLRGLAAFVVVLSHFRFLFDRSEQTAGTLRLLDGILFPFHNGVASVVLFFLLSGFVLSLPYKAGRPQPYRIFALRRLARIYVPYLAALAIALVADWQFHGAVPMSPWFNRTWTAPIDARLILDHVLLVGNYDIAQVNTAFWSLAVEMRLSLLFPLLCLPLLRWRRGGAMALFACMLAGNIALIPIFSHRLSEVSFSNLSDMGSGTLAFAGGILLSRYLDRAQTWWGRTPLVARAGFLAASIGLLEWGAHLPVREAWLFGRFLPIVGGLGVLLVALSSHRVTRVLSHRLPAWLGRVSYSLYLVHATVLFALMHHFGKGDRAEMFVPYLVLSFLAAAGFFFLVEKPSISLSRSIGRKGRMLSNQPVAAEESA